jgi:hypothetical protein
MKIYVIGQSSRKKVFLIVLVLASLACMCGQIETEPLIPEPLRVLGGPNNNIVTATATAAIGVQDPLEATATATLLGETPVIAITNTPSVVIPLPEDAIVLSEQGNEMNFGTDLSFVAVTDFYRAALLPLGWEEQSNTVVEEFGGTIVFDFPSNNRRVIVGLLPPSAWAEPFDRASLVILKVQDIPATSTPSPDGYLEYPLPEDAQSVEVEENRITATTNLTIEETVQFYITAFDALGLGLRLQDDYEGVSVLLFFDESIAREIQVSINTTDPVVAGQSTMIIIEWINP